MIRKKPVFPEKVCKRCARTFTPNSPVQKYCTPCAQRPKTEEERLISNEKSRARRREMGITGMRRSRHSYVPNYDSEILLSPPTTEKGQLERSIFSVLKKYPILYTPRPSRKGKEIKPSWNGSLKSPQKKVDNEENMLITDIELPEDES